MKALIACGGLLLAAGPGHGQAARPAARGGILCWQEKRPLRWADFQATRQPNVSVNTSHLAGLVLGGTIEANAVVYDRLGNKHYVGSYVRVEFDKSKSWLNQAYVLDSVSILAHEQLHFNIVELTGRKIRRILAQFAAQHNPLREPAVTAEIACAYEEEADLQNLYDEESQAGTNELGLGRWTALVYDSLAQLAKYKSTAKDCTLP